MARDVTKLHPTVRALAEELVRRMTAMGYKYKITECVRNEQEQNAYFEKGTSKQKYPYSLHCFGLAFDGCNNIRGDEGNKEVLAKAAETAKQIAAERRLNITWGGEWTSFVDRYHIQLDDYGTASQLVSRYGTPEKFFEMWGAPLPYEKYVSGTKIVIRKNAKYTNGKAVPSRYIGKELTVQQTKTDRVLIRELVSWVSLEYIEPASNGEYLPAYSGNGGIITALKAVGADSSKESRARIAEKNGIENYRYTSAQNTQMLKLLKAGKLLRP